MCDLCTKHGDGKVWYRNAKNYGADLLADLERRRYIDTFLTEAFTEGFQNLGRLEAIYRRKGRLPGPVREAMETKARKEHYGQVVPIEDITRIVQLARSVVRMPCACRWNLDKKEDRCCYALSYGPEAWYGAIDMGYFGKTQDEGLESLSSDEAIAQMIALEDRGAVHTIWTMMTPFIGAICNCSEAECLAMRTLARTGVETMERGEYRASVDAAACTGCGLCDSRCHFHAIAGVRLGGRSCASIDPVRCYGCGLCRSSCPAGAITLVPR